MNYPMHQADTEYNAELSIICESKIPDVARLGLLHGMDPQGIYEDILKMLPPNRRKCNDGEILAIINQAFATSRKPEPITTDSLPKHTAAKVKEPDRGPTDDVSNMDPLNKQFHFLSVAEVYQIKPRPWLIKNYLGAGDYAMIFGEPGSFKSFVALDMGASIATGTVWHGKEVRQQGAVFCLIGEGLYGYNCRLRAWEQSRGISLQSAPFFISDRPAQLLDQDSANDVVIAVDELREQHGNPVLIIIDTLNRNFGPGDENSTLDMSRFISTIDEKLRCKYQCAVLIIHHTGLTAADRARGNSALRAAVDWEYRLHGTEIRTLTNTKTKDHVAPPAISFKHEVIAIDGLVDPDDGESLTSIVLHRTGETAPDKGRILTLPQKIAMESLKKVIEVNGTDDGKVHIKFWREESYRAGISSTDKVDAKQKAFSRAISDLHKGGYINTFNDLWWPTPGTVKTGHGGH